MKTDAPYSSPQPTLSVGDKPVDTGGGGGGLKNEFGCTEKEESFAYWLTVENNRSLAYRRAYKVGVNTKPGTIWHDASEVAQRPHVAKRIAMLREAAAADAVANKAQLIKFLWDRILADRSEVVRYKAYCCRHCYGVSGQYQWKDETEYALAVAAWLGNDGKDPQTGKRTGQPSDEGGFGFDPHKPPNPACEHPQCMGDGHGRTVITATDQLTGSAMLIYEGMKETAQGIEVKLADRNADIAQLAKLLGWSIDKVQGAADGAGRGGPLPAEAYDIPSTATPEEASRKYLALVQ